MIDTGEKLNAQISGFVGQPGFSFALGYLKALEELVTKIGFVFVSEKHFHSSRKLKLSYTALKSISHFPSQILTGTLSVKVYLMLSADFSKK